MRYFARNFVCFFSCLLWGGTAIAQVHCEYAGESFSVGSTVCECPSLKAEGGYAAGGKARVSSQRLACGKDGSWVSANSLCIDITYENTAGVGQDDFEKYTNLYCPRLPINHDEIQKAIKQDTANFFAQAAKPVALIAIQAICNRYKIGPACNAIMDALATQSEGTGGR